MNDFISVIKELIVLFNELNAIEAEKIEAARKNRITYIEECIKQEQAAMLRMRGLDKKREECQEALGFKDYTFKQMLEAVPDQMQILKPLFDQLSSEVTVFRDSSDSAHKLIELNLHQINTMLAKQQDTGTAYTKDGTVTTSAKHFTSKKI